MTREQMIDQINDIQTTYHDQLTDEIIDFTEEVALDQLDQLERDLALLNDYEGEE